jgi:hypothetical protein
MRDAMTRGVRPLTAAFVAALVFAGGATAHAQVSVQISADSRVVEGDSGQVTVNLSVTLSAPNLSGVTSVQWSTREGTALAGSDFDAVAPTTLTWGLGDGTPRPISVKVNADNAQEWFTSQVDDQFFVVLENPVGATIANRSVTVTILDDDHPGVNDRPGVQFLSAVSGSVSPHGATNGQVRLQWRVPAGATPATGLMIRENVGAACTFPLSTTDGVGVFTTGTLPPPGTTQFFNHAGLGLGTTHCYSVFVTYAGGPSPAVQIKGTPFGASGSIAWKYTAGTTILTPPTVGADAIYVTDTIGVVHALQRTTSGGMWPSTWNPVAVGQTNTRSAAVPRPEGWRLYLGTNSGGLHSVNGRTGAVVWSRNTTNGLALPNLGGVQAQPGGIFKNFGGANDMLLVGTNAGVGSNEFYAFDPTSGNPLDALGTAATGNILGMPVVDYAGNRVFFLSSSGTETVYAMSLGASGSPDLTMAPLPWNPKPAGSGSNGSLVLRNNRFYFGDALNLFALHMDGTLYGTATGDGTIKGFVWPDRRNDNLYFSTNTKVHAMRDTGSGFVNVISAVSVTSPSMVLQKPNTDILYVGDGNGNLVQINLISGVLSIALEPGVQMGAPSYDAEHGLMIIGSNTGNVYAVRVPF